MSQEQKVTPDKQVHNRKHRPKHGVARQHPEKDAKSQPVQPTEKNIKSGSPLKSFGRIVKRPLIKEAVKEVTAGGVVYRINSANVIEVLLAQDSRDRWTIPKGHVEPGEITSQTAEREVREETDLQEMKVYEHLGKSTFQYRRQNTLVLMTMHIFLIEARGNTAAIRTVDPWMKSIGWFEFSTALDMIQYEAIETLMLVGLRKIRERAPGAKISA
jgi:ADP-ribose pyrophosphatase YjhB (NUDIX family)